MLHRKCKHILKKHKIYFSIYFLEKESSDSNVNFDQEIPVLLFIYL